jgi:hypothetical protein
MRRHTWALAIGGGVLAGLLILLAWLQIRTVDVHVAALRKKLEINVRAPVHIITVHGLGYKFVG